MTTGFLHYTIQIDSIATTLSVLSRQFPTQRILPMDEHQITWPLQTPCINREGSQCWSNQLQNRRSTISTTGFLHFPKKLLDFHSMSFSEANKQFPWPSSWCSTKISEPQQQKWKQNEVKRIINLYISCENAFFFYNWEKKQFHLVKISMTFPGIRLQNLPEFQNFSRPWNNFQNFYWFSRFWENVGTSSQYASICCHQTCGLIRRTESITEGRCYTK